MVKCIECEAAVNAILSLVPKVDEDGYCWVIRGDAARAIDSIPTADVRPIEWIPVKERLPQICTNVLVAGRMKYRWEHKYMQFVDKAFFNEGEFFETSNDWYEGQDEFEITHWMPLPEPPMAEEGK